MSLVMFISEARLEAAGIMLANVAVISHALVMSMMAYRRYVFDIANLMRYERNK
jgi:hypothetical protein